jgi:hypothetical protein
MFLIFNNRLLPRLRFPIDENSVDDSFEENEVICVKRLISERLRLEGRSSFIKVYKFNAYSRTTD